VWCVSHHIVPSPRCRHLPPATGRLPRFAAYPYRFWNILKGWAILPRPPFRRAFAGGFTVDDFHINTAAGKATCPAGHTVALGRPHATGSHIAQFKKVCAPCPLRARCTTSATGRNVTIHAQHDLLAAARDQAVTDSAWQADYRRWRPPVERAVAQVVARGNRRLRYLGVIKNNTWLHTRAAALNLRTLINLGLTRTNGAWTLAPSST
jgi:hypothetical protein